MVIKIILFLLRRTNPENKSVDLWDSILALPFLDQAKNRTPQELRYEQPRLLDFPETEIGRVLFEHHRTRPENHFQLLQESPGLDTQS